jgi:hypothetical protein
MSIIAAGIVSLLAVTGGLPDVMWQGNQDPASTAWAAGMGNCGFLEASALGALGNPAMLGLADSGLRFDLSGGAVFSSEKRTRLVYDSFGSSIGEAEYAFNTGIQFFPAGAAVSVSEALGFPEVFSAAVGWRVPRTFGYDYGRTVRDNSYVETGEESLEITGMENELAASIAFSPSDALTFGVGGGFVTGSRNVQWKVDWVDPSIADVMAVRKETITGAVVRGALLFAPQGRVTCTVVVEYPMPLSFSPVETGDPITWNTLSDTDYDLDQPMTVTAGARYVPGNRLMSIFAGELYWSGDGSLEFEGESLGLHNAWGFRTGVENTLPGGPIARFGFSFDRSPVSPELDRMTFTAGMGFHAGPWALDAGLGFTPDRWRQTMITGLPSFVSGDSLQVEETSTRLTISLSRTFDV